MFHHIVAVALLFGIVFSDQVFYVEYDGTCDEITDICTFSRPCDLICPFSQGGRRITEKRITVRLVDEIYDLSNYQVSMSSILIHVANDSIDLTIESYFNKNQSTQTVFQSFPSSDSVGNSLKNGTIFYIAGNGVSLSFRNVEFRNIHPRNANTDFLGSVVTVREESKLDSVNFFDCKFFDLDMIFNAYSDKSDYFNFIQREWNVVNVTMTGCSISSVHNSIWMKLISSNSIRISNSTFFNISRPIEDTLLFYKTRIISIWSESDLGQFTLEVTNCTFSSISGVDETVSLRAYGNIEMKVSSSRFHNIRGNVIYVSGINPKDGCGGPSTNLHILDSEFCNCSDEGISDFQFLLRFELTTPRQCKSQMNKIVTLKILNSNFFHNWYETHLSLEDLASTLESMNTTVDISDSMFSLNRGKSDWSSLLRFLKYSASEMDYLKLRISNSVFSRNSRFDYLVYTFIPLRVSSFSDDSNSNSVIHITRTNFTENYEDYESLIKIYVVDLFAVSHDSSNSRLYKIDDCNFLSNRGNRMVSIKWTEHFGYVYSDDYELVVPRFVVSRSLFFNNSGVGVYSVSDVKIDISHCKFLRNELREYSVIYIGRLNLGICENIYDFSVEHSEFVGNSGFLGGAIYGSNVYMNLRNISFVRNSAYYGGAMFIKNSMCQKYNQDGNSDMATWPILDNLMFKHNFANELGGAVYIQQNPSVEGVNMTKNLYSNHFLNFVHFNNTCGNKVRFENYVSTNPGSIKFVEKEKEKNICKYVNQNFWSCVLELLEVRDILGQMISASPFENVNLYLEMELKNSKRIKYTLLTNDDMSHNGVSFIINDESISDEIKSFIEFDFFNFVYRSEVSDMKVSFTLPLDHYSNPTTIHSKVEYYMHDTNAKSLVLVIVIPGSLILLFILCLCCVICFCICGVYVLGGVISLIANEYNFYKSTHEKSALEEILKVGIIEYEKHCEFGTERLRELNEDQAEDGVGLFRMTPTECEKQYVFHGRIVGICRGVIYLKHENICYPAFCGEFEGGLRERVGTEYFYSEKNSKKESDVLANNERNNEDSDLEEHHGHDMAMIKLQGDLEKVKRTRSSYSENLKHGLSHRFFKNGYPKFIAQYRDGRIERTIYYGIELREFRGNLESAVRPFIEDESFRSQSVDRRLEQLRLKRKFIPLSRHGGRRVEYSVGWFKFSNSLYHLDSEECEYTLDESLMQHNPSMYMKKKLKNRKKGKKRMCLVKRYMADVFAESEHFRNLDFSDDASDGSNTTQSSSNSSPLSSLSVNISENIFGCPVPRMREEEENENDTTALKKEERSQMLDNLRNILKIFVVYGHRNIVDFYGILSGKFVGYVTEYCESSLGFYISNLQTIRSEMKPAYVFEEKLRVLSEIAAGMKHIHTCGIVHSKLTINSILVTEHPLFRIRISDFDFAFHDMMYKSGGWAEGVNSLEFGYPFFYFSPEQLKGGMGSFKSDVFSFGVLIYEILFATRKEGYVPGDPFFVIQNRGCGRAECGRAGRIRDVANNVAVSSFWVVTGKKGHKGEKKVEILEEEGEEEEVEMDEKKKKRKGQMNGNSHSDFFLDMIHDISVEYPVGYFGKSKKREEKEKLLKEKSELVKDVKKVDGKVEEVENLELKEEDEEEGESEEEEDEKSEKNLQKTGKEVEDEINKVEEDQDRTFEIDHEPRQEEIQIEETNEFNELLGEDDSDQDVVTEGTKLLEKHKEVHKKLKIIRLEYYDQYPPEWIIELMKQCTHRDPKKRPGFEEIVKKFENFYMEVKISNSLREKENKLTRGEVSKY